MRRFASLLASVALAMALATAAAQAPDRIDTQRPDAPELAAYGEHDVGVRTLELVDPGRPDILNAAEGETTPTYDRPLTVEVWYPPPRCRTAPSRAAPTPSPPVTARPRPS